MVNGSNIAFTIARLDDRSCIGSVIVVANPALVFLVPIVIYVTQM